VINISNQQVILNFPNDITPHVVFMVPYSDN